MEKESAIVEHILREFMYQHDCSGSHPKLLVFFTPGVSRLEESVKSIRSLRQKGISITLFMEEDKVEGCDRIDLMKQTGIDDWLVNEKELEQKCGYWDHILLPAFSPDLATKLENVQDHFVVVRTIVRSLLQGKHIYSFSSVKNEIWKSKASPALKQKLTSFISKFQQLGIQFVNEDELVAIVKGKNLTRQPTLITEKEIIHLQNEGVHVIEASTHTIITPLARELAKANKIEIVKKE